ncbi:1-(5-phosphoribosyl)-5-[(5-phosphoribosylamino)methylideneamino]imidazole-4-carboxamide isomerase [Candidatus Omnitrophota bacterium]
MLIIPAIDLKDGCVVRLVQGRSNKKIYSRDALKVARHWLKQGAKMLHVVDLDGAFTGIPRNLDLVASITKNVDVPVQFGGGVRSFEAIRKLFAFGVSRVVLGTKAIEDEAFLRRAFAAFKQKIIVSLDTKAGRLQIKGWRGSSKLRDALKFSAALREIGFKQAIFTDTQKDGTLKGPNIQEVKRFLKSSGLKLIASGGISSLDDIFKLKLLERSGLTGVIVGKALYEGRFSLRQALKVA